MNDRGDLARTAAAETTGRVARHTTRRVAGRAVAATATSSGWVLPALIAAVLLVATVGCTGLMLFAGAGSTPPPGCGHTYTAPAGNERILATIRTMETGSRYDTRVTTSTASGAYAFIDAAWRHYAASVGVDVTRYTSAWMAPTDAQDATANAYVNEILAKYQGDVTVIPVAWYLPSAIRRPELMDRVPAMGGNVLTPRQYQQRWLREYERQANPTATTAPAIPVGAPTAAPAGLAAPSLDHSSCVDDIASAVYTAPPGVTELSACEIAWGGYQPGRIPATAMRSSPHSGLMHPAASAAWDQLWDAANREGLNLDGNSYRPATRSSGARCSNHNWGLAIDVSVLTGPAGFETPEYRWLAANARRYGYANPRFARPVSLGGTGRGGWAGGTCCHLEPWHWEFVAFLRLPAAAPT